MIRSVLLCFLGLWIVTRPLVAQEINGGIRYNYVENDRLIAQTGASDVKDYQLRRDAEGELNVYMFHIDGFYKSFNVMTTVESEETTFVDIDRNTNAVIGLGNFALLSLDYATESTYEYLQSSAMIFGEDESKRLQINGFGLALGNLRLAYFPYGDYDWEYEVAYKTNKVFSENIRYKVSVFQIERRTPVEPGGYLDFRWTRTKHKETLENREGDLAYQNSQVEIGWFSEKGSQLWFKNAAEKGTFESILADDKLSLEEKVSTNFFQVGIRYVLNEDESIILRKESHQRTTKVVHEQFKSEKIFSEDVLTVGMEFSSKSLEISLRFSQTAYERNIEKTSVFTSESDYAVDDSLLGISIKYSFSTGGSAPARNSEE